MSNLRSILQREGLIPKTASSEAMRVVEWAKAGQRVIVGGKTIWAGLGNPSGLHDYGRELKREKWAKSGERFQKVLDGLPEGTVVELWEFQNITRDRGKWNLSKKVVMPAPLAGAMPPALLRKAIETIALIDQSTPKIVSAVLYTGPDALFSGEVWELTTRSGRKIQWSKRSPNEYGEGGDTLGL